MILEGIDATRNSIYSSRMWKKAKRTGEWLLDGWWYDEYEPKGKLVYFQKIGIDPTHEFFQDCHNICSFIPAIKNSIAEIFERKYHETKKLPRVCSSYEKIKKDRKAHV